MVCPLCNDTGEQRYWEGRWRDADAALRALYDDCADYIRLNNLYRADGKSAIWNETMQRAAEALGIKLPSSQ